LAGCTGSRPENSARTPTTVDSVSPQPSSTAGMGPSSNSFKGTVNLRDYGSDCDSPDEFCWLPTQFDPVIVSGQTVSERETIPGRNGNGWPKQDDMIDVLCKTTGQEYQDVNRVKHTDWYGVGVPNDKLEPNPGTNKKPLKLDQGYLAYVQAAWVAGGANEHLLDCSRLK